MRMKFRFLTPERSEFMKEEVKRWLQLGYAVSSHGPFASPVVVVKKADGSHRFCIDYKRINDNHCARYVSISRASKKSFNGLQGIHSKRSLT